MELVSCFGYIRVVVYDLFVRVFFRRRWKDCIEFYVRGFDVSVYLLVLKILKNMVERMVNVGSYVLVEVNFNGRMNLIVEIDRVIIKSYFKNFGNFLNVVLCMF